MRFAHLASEGTTTKFALKRCGGYGTGDPLEGVLRPGYFAAGGLLGLAWAS